MRSFTLILFSSLFTSIFLFVVLPANAHRLNVFAYEENGEIRVEAKFSGGRAAKNSLVIVENQQGQTLLQGKTDEQGTFSFPIPDVLKEKQADITITVSPGDGHRGSWTLEAQDYLAEIAADIHPPETEAPLSVQSGTEHENKCTVDEAKLREIIGRELAPIKRALAQEKVKKVTHQDILGGLGYILGLAGIATFIHYRKTEK